MKRKGYLTAAVLTSVMFSLMHGNVDQLVHQFFVGMVLAYVMQVTGNLLAPMIIHFCNNFFALALQYVAIFIEKSGLVEIPEETASVADMTAGSLLFYVFMILFGSVFLIMALNYFMRLENEKRAGNKSIDVNRTGFISNYFSTAKKMLMYVFSFKSRREMNGRYNDSMAALDYDKPAEEEEQDILLKIARKDKDNLIAVKLGILGAALIVLITFLAGFAEGLLGELK
jgi:hypothetical protein